MNQLKFRVFGLLSEMNSRVLIDIGQEHVCRQCTCKVGEEVNFLVDSSSKNEYEVAR
jgi:hypothetical protein